jgi:hypothetical protein
VTLPQATRAPDRPPCSSYFPVVGLQAAGTLTPSGSSSAIRSRPLSVMTMPMGVRSQM